MNHSKYSSGKVAEMYSKGRIMLTLEGGYEVDKQAIGV
jgi:acetoin utilization deacetylase AcuC-like enzyme